MNNDMKIIFLDIDGVLNSRSSVAVYGDEKTLDPVACGLLNKLLRETGAHIVIVSNWRHGLSLDELRKKLHKRAGKKIARRTIGKISDAALPRGQLVDAWFHVEQFDGTYVIIDDKADYTSEQLKCYVQPDPQVGFKLSDYDQAYEILMQKRNYE